MASARRGRQSEPGAAPHLALHVRHQAVRGHRRSQRQPAEVSDRAAQCLAGRYRPEQCHVGRQPGGHAAESLQPLRKTPMTGPGGRIDIVGQCPGLSHTQYRAARSEMRGSSHFRRCVDIAPRGSHGRSRDSLAGAAASNPGRCCGPTPIFMNWRPIPGHETRIHQLRFRP